MAYVEYTISKIEDSDFCSLQDAINHIPDPVTCHFKLTFLDVETYEEQVVVNKTVEDGGSITVVGKYNEYARTRLTSHERGLLLDVNANNFTTYGMWYDVRRCVNLNAIRLGYGYSVFTVVRNYFTAGCPQNESIAIELMGDNDQILIYNNLFRGFAAEAQIVVH